MAQVLVVAGGETSAHHLVEQLRGEISTSFPGSRVTVRELEQGPLVGTPIAIRISGEDLSELKSIAGRVADILDGTPGTVNVHEDMGPDAYTIKVNSTPDLTSRWGVAERDIASSVRMAVDGLKISDYRRGDKIFPVVLRSSGADRASLSDLSSIWVPSWKTGSVLPLTQVASLEAGWTGTITRRNLERVVTVRAYTDGTLPDTILNSASKQIESVTVPPGYRIEYGGEDEERKTAFASIGRLSVVVGILIYYRNAGGLYGTPWDSEPFRHSGPERDSAGGLY